MGAESSTMQNAASTCKGCKNLGNKQVDTVKLDMEKFRGASGSAAAGKENSDPGQMRESPAQKNQREQEQQLKEAEERDARHRAEVEREEAMRRAVEEAKERKRIAAEQEEARRVELARAAEQKRRQVEEEERLSRIQEEAEEERLLKQKEEEEEAREEALRRQAEEEEKARRNQRLQAFLEKTGFDAVDEKKVKKGIISSGFFYPLHAAVEQKDAEAVELLLWAGADPCLANSKKLTPLKLAQAKNKQGSHDKVIAALAA